MHLTTTNHPSVHLYTESKRERGRERRGQGGGEKKEEEERKKRGGGEKVQTTVCVGESHLLPNCLCNTSRFEGDERYPTVLKSYAATNTLYNSPVPRLLPVLGERCRGEAEHDLLPGGRIRWY